MRATTASIFLGLLTLISASLAFADEKASDKPAAKSAENAKAETFKQPTTLAELLALPTDQLEKVDIARMNLLCAEGLRGSENLNVEECLRTLEAWTHHVERETKRNFHHFLERPKEFNNSIPYYQMGMLGTVLAEDLRIQYNPERERQLLEKPVNLQSVDDENTFFSSSTDVFIHGLLTGKHYGTCASMPFLYAAIGRRLGYPVTIAARKYHLYVRYEAGNGEHLNLEATENRGFSTPTDEEYRTGQYPMTQEEIDGCGWLRPLDNKHILGICLLNRAHSLRSMKRYDDEISTFEQASRYLPDTALMRRASEKNKELARKLHAADRWDELWDELEKLPLPTAGPMFEHFHNRKLAIQLSMNQSTNLAEIEKSVSGLKADLRRYQNEISDDLAKSAEAFGLPQPPATQQKFLALLQDGLTPRHIRIPQEGIPREYWNGIPAELQSRLRKLAKEQEIIEEMNVYAAEEARLRNLEANHPTDRSHSPVPVAQKPGTIVRPENLPPPWRGRPIPPELQERLASLNAIGEPSARQMRIRDEVNKFFIDQDQRQFAVEAVRKRRSPLDQQPVTQLPLQIEIVPSSAESNTIQNLPNSLLTPTPERQIKSTTTDTGKP